MSTGKLFESAFPIENSNYIQLAKLEHEEILKLKWCESEKIGKDCGMEYAVWIWCMRYRTNWINYLKQSGIYHL